MRATTLNQRRRLYLQARAVVAHYYRRPLTVTAVSRALSSSPRQLQRAYAQFGHRTFQQDLSARRMTAARALLAQYAIPVRDVARLVGYRQASHFARAFRARYGISPTRFREQARRRLASSDRKLDRFNHHGQRGNDPGWSPGPSALPASIQAKQREHHAKHASNHRTGDRRRGRR